jgi:hypothetical protein
MLLVASGAGGIAACATHPTSAQSNAADDTVDSQVAMSLWARIYFKVGNRLRAPERVTWSSTPDEGLLNDVYRDVPGGVHGTLRCSASGDRRLQACQVEASDHPAHPSSQPILLRLAQEFRLAPTSPPPAEIAYVGVTIVLRRGSESGPCVLPFCVIHFAPPPEPPPPPDNGMSG